MALNIPPRELQGPFFSSFRSLWMRPLRGTFPNILYKTATLHTYILLVLCFVFLLYNLLLDLCCLFVDWLPLLEDVRYVKSGTTFIMSPGPTRVSGVLAALDKYSLNKCWLDENVHSTDLNSLRYIIRKLKYMLFNFQSADLCINVGIELSTVFTGALRASQGLPVFRCFSQLLHTQTLYSHS